MKNIKFVIFSLIFLIIITPLIPEKLKKKFLPGNYDIQSGKNQATLPFKFENNQIILHGYIDEKKFRIVLDSGYPNDQILLFNKNKTLRKLGIKPKLINKVPNSYKFIRQTTIKFDKLKLNKIYLVIKTMSKEQLKYASSFDGIIGYSIFKHFVVDVNLIKNKITLIKQEYFKYNGNGLRMLLTLRKSLPYINCNISLTPDITEQMHCVIDTGSGANLIIVTDKTKLPKNIKTYKEIVTGLSLICYINKFRANSIKFGELILKKPIFSKVKRKIFNVAPGGMANLGMGILKRFHFIIDYSRKEMILEPNKNFDFPFEYDMSGISYYFNDNRKMFVTQIDRNSVASKAGLLVDDEILSINEKPINEYSNDQISDLLKKHEKKISLYIKRDDVRKKIVFILKRLI